MVEHKYICGNCGNELTVDGRPCPKCGSSRRNVYVTITESLHIQSGVKATARDKIGKIISKHYVRNKISKHGKKAKEELKIDLAGKWKFHHVEELDKDGNWIVVHDEKTSLDKHGK